MPSMRDYVIPNERIGIMIIDNRDKYYQKKYILDFIGSEVEKIIDKHHKNVNVKLNTWRLNFRKGNN